MACSIILVLRHHRTLWSFQKQFTLVLDETTTTHSHSCWPIHCFLATAAPRLCFTNSCGDSDIRLRSFSQSINWTGQSLDNFLHLHRSFPVTVLPVRLDRWRLELKVISDAVSMSHAGQPNIVIRFLEWSNQNQSV